LFAHRISYLPLLLPRLHAFFKRFLVDADALPHRGWFSFENVPLKWHHPVGLLFDLYSGAKDQLVDENGAKDASASQEVESILPWKLVLHFSAWPEDQIIALDPEWKVLHDTFYNSVKEVRLTVLFSPC
jgi:autophagy-related protein 5